ncbi:MAG: phasin family protein [Legionellaceae bacterium]|nr:phasin family protein [Legionellaceae bacterium]
MNQEYLEKWSEIAKNAQQPFQEIAELNVKTIQSLSFVKPEEMVNLKKPEEFAEKNLNVMIENSHKLLDYMQKAFKIFEKTMASALKEAQKKADEVKK